jgi:hypothetical protein
MINRQAILLPTEQLHQVTSSIDENKYISTQDLLLHLLFYQPAQSVKRFAHIGTHPVQKIAPVIMKG